jgi:opacity protein-like surface antigen
MRRSPTSIAVSLALACFAEGASAAGIGALGLKGGLSASTLHGRLPTDAFITNGTRYGFAGGVSLEIGLGGWLTLQPEALFVMKGTSLGSIDITGPGGTVIGTAKVTEAVDYLEFPILARIGLPSVGPVSPYLLAGPAVAVRLSQKIRVSGTATGSGGIDLFRSADLGLALGPGVELGRGHVRGSLDLRYTLGLTPAAEDVYSDDARNGALMVMAGITIRP